LALLSAGLLALAFWALMYSRSGQRHVMVTVTTLLAFGFYWAAVQRKGGYGLFTGAGLALGVGFYTYFASRGVPLIIIAWVGYLAVWKRDLFRDVWKGTLLTLGVALLCAMPLIVTLQQQPEAEARVAELAKPIYDARDGDFTTIGRYTVITLSMFTHDGDDEALYNVPHRPVFSAVGGVLFWVGVGLALVWTFGPRRDERTAFLLLWLGAGLAPGVLSVPAASLGHTILAQSPTMVLAALAAWEGVNWLTQHTTLTARFGAALLALFVLLEGARDVYAYWWVWPQTGFTEVLHHSDLYEAAQWLNAHTAEGGDLAIGSFLIERWDMQAVDITLDDPAWRIRAFDPREVALYMGDAGYVVVPGYLSEGWGLDKMPGKPLTPSMAAYTPPEHPDDDPAAIFANGLTLLSAHVEDEGDTLEVMTEWIVSHELDLPPRPLLSKPPAPDEDDTPRLRIFHHMIGPNGEYILGYDAMGVDPYTLYPGDRFIQRVIIDVRRAGDDAGLVIGLYDPQTGERIPTQQGEETLALP
jgi:hypothetical protein